MKCLRYMYHVAPTEGRQQILQTGIDWSRRTINLWDEYGEGMDLPEYGSEEWPEGNYFWAKFANAAIYTGQWVSYVDVDIWEIDTRGLNLLCDPQFGRGDSYYVEEAVTPAHLRLIAHVWKENAQLCEDAPAFPVIAPRQRGFLPEAHVEWFARPRGK